MRCQVLELHITDLARGSVMDAAVRAEALGHLDNCSSCNRLLADHRRLSEGLRALAESERAIAPPASIEESLLLAMRNNAPSTASHGRRWTPWLAVAAAAMLLAALATTSFIMRNSDEPTGPKHVSDLAGAGLPPVESRETGPGKVSEGSIETGAAVNPDALVATSHRTGNLKKAGNRSRTQPATAKQSSGREITTDFIPLSYGAEYIPIESGQLIRVKMPRSSLISFGLPMSQDRINEQVKADILVSNDGLAHAIRFVQ